MKQSKILFLILLLLCATTSFANVPVYIKSDRAEFDEINRITTYIGHVKARQGGKHLKANTLVVTRDKKGQIKKAVAKGGPAYFDVLEEDKQAPITGYADIIHWYPDDDKVIFLKKAYLHQEETNIYGEKLTYFLDTKKLIADKVKNHRTTIVFQPKEA